MRLTTWNCFRGDIRRRLQQLAPLHPDLVVLQECRRPSAQPSLLEPDAPPFWTGIREEQGVTVATLTPAVRLKPFAIPALPATIVAMSVEGPTSFLLVGVWTLPKPTYPEMALSALSICASAARRPLVAMGDFNMSPNVSGQEKSAPEFFRMMREHLGLISAYHSYFGVEPGCEEHPTYYHQRNESLPFHLDYIFIPESWVTRITSVEVGSYSLWNSHSDHRPLTVELTL